MRYHLQALDDLAYDLRYAARAFRRSVGFTAAAVLTIAIGIAATTIIVSAVNALLLRPLPVREPDRLFVLDELQRNGYTAAPTTMAMPVYSYDHYLEYRDATASIFSGLAAFQYSALSLRIGDEARVLSGIVASSNYFNVLGLTPALGRFFSPMRDGAGAAEPEVVIGYDLWQRDYAADRAAIGRTLYVDSRALVIVGVAPRGFNGTMAGLAVDAWVPATLYQRPGSLTIFGRLRPGLPIEQAHAAIKVIGQRIDKRTPKIADVRLEPLAGIPAMARGTVAGFMAMMFVTAALVLLIAATNVAGMLLARATARRREVSVRLALGAGRGRLVRQLVTESVVLCAVGGAAGVLLASWLTGLFPAVELPMVVRTALDLGLDPTVLAVAVAITLAAGILTGLAPALQSTRLDLLGALRMSGAEAPRQTRMRTGFVTAQLAMSLVLLVTAGLFVRALRYALVVDPGFDPTGVVAADIGLGPHGYDEEHQRAFYAQLVERLSARPEIASASLGWWTPLSSNNNGEMIVRPEGATSDVQPANPGLSVVDAGWFETVRAPIVAGRGFTRADSKDAPPVVVINERLARRFWPIASPIGQRLEFGAPGSIGHTYREVVGVARDGKYRDLGEQPRGFIFVPLAQRHVSQVTIFARSRGACSPSAGGCAAVIAALRAELAVLNPNIALRNPGLLADRVDVNVMPQRAAAWMIGVFGLVGLLLAAIGVYGVLAYHVAQRTREFGVRLALGAHAGDLARMVLRHALRLVAIGAGVGLVLALAVSRLAKGFLFGVGAADPLTFTLVPLLLGAVALVASYIPARRAARVDPMVSLRSE